MQWESKCDYVQATFQQFIDWSEGSDLNDNPLHPYDKEYYWCYADYNYMKEMFAEHPDLIKVRTSIERYQVANVGGAAAVYPPPPPPPPRMYCR